MIHDAANKNEIYFFAFWFSYDCFSHHDGPTFPAFYPFPSPVRIDVALDDYRSITIHYPSKKK